MRGSKRVKRLGKLADIARREERQVREALGRTQRALDEHNRQLNELEQYRRDYGGQFGGRAQVSPARWQDYQHFLERIDDAVVEQRAQVEAARQTLDVHRRRWLARRQRLESIERVVDKIRKDDLDAAERREQRALDELTLSASHSRQHGDA